MYIKLEDECEPQTVIAEIKFKDISLVMNRLSQCIIRQNLGGIQTNCYDNAYKSHFLTLILQCITNIFRIETTADTLLIRFESTNGKLVSNAIINMIEVVCGTVSSILSGLETRSLGLNTLDTT